ncbi:MAG: UDP-N-acetylmuramoyl-L-alanine--D-glutamate ligase [Patescibacteria group bacterium]|nr:UDP-N-acetylmuramoyl-L-alanine--D-glutamate ligase [Patescibacteria group bacterium]
MQGKKIAVVGFGREGKSLASFFLKHGFAFSVLDKHEVADISGAESVAFGENYLSRLSEFDVVFKSPGVKLSAEFPFAEKQGTVITSATELFFRLCTCPILGVTGTKGKGTVSGLTAEILKASGREVFLGGNIGVPPLDFLEKLGQESLVVLELSSFQLQNLKISPRYACVLNFYIDHLDQHQDMQEYWDAKSSIVKFQNPGDVAILNADDERVKNLSERTSAKKYWFSLTKIAEPGAYLLEDTLYLNIDGQVQELCLKNDLKVRGEHNVSDVLAAAVLAAAAGAPLNSIRKTLKVFTGLPHHRLEYAGEINKVSFYNDSLATIPEAAIAAIRAFAENKVLILGGSDKGADYAGLAQAVAASNVRAAVLIGQTGEKIQAELKKVGFSGRIEIGKSNMPDIVAAALKLSVPGDVVLLSPAAASFDMFTSYVDRGEQFKQAVSDLKQHVQAGKI